MTRPARRVLMLGLDAADASFVERLEAGGRMPELSRLRAAGCSGELSTPATEYAGGVWPCFYGGEGVARHGIYHNKQWRAGAMRCEVPTDAWLGRRPFWESLGEHGLRVCVIDAPMVLGHPRPVPGLCLAGWGTHDLVSRGSWPGPLWREVRRRHGPPLMPAERTGAQSAATLEQLAERLLAATRQARDIALDLLARESWDFGCVVLGATHRAGHYLWDLSQVETDALPAARGAALLDRLALVHETADAAMAEIVDAAPPDTLVVAFAAHGMGPNPGWADFLPGILQALERASTGRAAPSGLAYRLRGSALARGLGPLVGALPTAVKDRLVAFWSAGMFDWRTTRSFPLPMDHAAYLRVNLRGRERDGIVDADGYAQECERLARLVLGLRDADSGRPLASRALRAYAQTPQDARHRDELPDLVIPWDGPRASQARTLTCDGVPGFHYDVPARIPSGRSGNHRGPGWFVAHGAHAEPGRRVTGHSIVDLAPTILQALGIKPQPHHEGRPILLRVGASA